MNYTEIYNYALIKCFSLYNYYRERKPIYTSLYNQQDIYCLSVIDISNPIIEIPLFARSCIEYLLELEIIDNRLPEEERTKEVVIKMDEELRHDVKRSAKTILRNMSKFPTSEYKLQKILTNKGKVYYISKGAIFDNEFNALMLCTITGKRIEEIPTEGNYRDILCYSNPTVYIHPKVFLSTDLIEKFIVKEIIPYYLTNKIPLINTPLYFKSNVVNCAPTLLIQDGGSKFLRFPRKPSISNCTDEVFNQLLIKNISNIV